MTFEEYKKVATKPIEPSGSSVFRESRASTVIKGCK